ncbi:MAG: PH domain-containing protein [Pseudomonadota bacterium]
MLLGFARNISFRGGFMGFRNLQVDEADVPRAAVLELQPMAPAYQKEVRTQQFLTWVPIVLLGFIPSVLVASPSTVKFGLLAIPAFSLLLAAGLVPLILAQARVKAFAVREHDVALRSGLYFRKTVILPYNRIQHAEVSQGPLQRRFGLASLKIFTAGGTSVDLRIDGLEAQRAEDLREYVLERAAGRDGD